MSRMLNALKRIEAKSPHRPPPPSIRAEQSVATEVRSDIREEVRDEAAMEGSLLEAEAAMVSERLPVDAQKAPIVDAYREPAPVSDTVGESDNENRLAYEALGGEILSQLTPGQPSVLMFTSPRHGGDTTDILLSLVESLAERVEGQILLVDVDLHEPRLAERLGIDARQGLADVLQGVATWEEVVRPTDIARVSLLPGVKFTSQGGGSLERLDLGPLLGELSAGYGLVLLDTASLDHAEIAPVSRWCQGTYLAIRLGLTRRGEALEAERLVHGYGGQVTGCVVVG